MLNTSMCAWGLLRIDSDTLFNSFAFCKKFVNIHLNEPEAFHFPYQQMFLVLPSSQVMSLTMTNGCQNVILVDLTI